MVICNNPHKTLSLVGAPCTTTYLKAIFITFRFHHLFVSKKLYTEYTERVTLHLSFTLRDMIHFRSIRNHKLFIDTIYRPTQALIKATESVEGSLSQ